MITFFEAIWRYKWLVIAGAVVAVGAAFAAGFKVEDGSLEPRATQSYSSETTILLTSPRSSVYQAVVPGQALAEGQTPATPVDLTRSALVFAYLAIGAETRALVTDQIGPLGEGESFTAVQRTTQPRDDEPPSVDAAMNRLALPILAIEATAGEEARAQAIAETAAVALQSQVTASQEAGGILPEDRVQLNVIDTQTVLVTSGNSTLPMIVTGLGVFAAFVALALLLNRARTARITSAREEDRDAEDPAAESNPVPAPTEGENEGRVASRRRDLEPTSR